MTAGVVPPDHAGPPGKMRHPAQRHSDMANVENTRGVPVPAKGVWWWLAFLTSGLCIQMKEVNSMKEASSSEMLKKAITAFAFLISAGICLWWYWCSP